MPREVEVFMSYATTLTVEAKRIKRNRSMQKYPPAVRQCFFDGEKRLQFFKSYTRLNCELECLANNTLKTCGCVQHWMVRGPNTTICDPLDERCAGGIFKKILIQRQSLDGYSVPCDCLLPCNDIKYAVKDIKSQLLTDEDPFFTTIKDHKG